MPNGKITLRMTMNNDIMGFDEFNLLIEAFNTNVTDVQRDHNLESFVKMMIPDEHHDSVRVLYSPEMHKSELRVIRFSNDRGQMEYHVHSNVLLPGTKSSNTSPRAFLHAVSIIQSDAKDAIDSGKDIALQTIVGSQQHQKYQLIANQIAARHNKRVYDGGIHPLTSLPFMSGKVLVIK